MKSVGGAVFIMLIPPKKKSRWLDSHRLRLPAFLLLVTVRIIHANSEDLVGMDRQSHVTSLNRQG
jgi:hypothetical protein